MLGLRQLFANFLETADHARRVLNGIDAVWRIRRMARRALHMAAHCELAFMAEHGLEFRWLTDQTQGRLRRTPFEFREHRSHAEASDFFVVRKGEVYGQR